MSDSLRTRMRAGVVIFVILGLTAVGASAGIAGTAVPTVDPPSTKQLDVALMTPRDPKAPDAAPYLELTFGWIMSSDGDVELYAHSGGTDDTFFVYLFCGIRMTFEYPMKPGFEGVGVQAEPEKAGSEAACARPPGTGDKLEDRAHQIIEIRGRASISGTPFGVWTDTANGKRIARTPAVELDLAFDGLVAPLRTSKAATALSGTASEALDNATPAALSEGRVDYGSDWRIFGPDDTLEFAAVLWDTESPEDSGNAKNLRPGIARWTLLEGEQTAQMYTLLSGVLLGVAAAVLVEWLLGPLLSKQKREGTP